MAMPDAVRALMDLAGADRDRLTTCVYNIGAFSLSAAQIAERVKQGLSRRPHRLRARPRAHARSSRRGRRTSTTRAPAPTGAGQPRYPWDRSVRRVPRPEHHGSLREVSRSSAARIDAGKRRGPARRAVDEDVHEPARGPTARPAAREDADLVAHARCARGARRAGRRRATSGNATGRSVRAVRLDAEADGVAAARCRGRPRRSGSG